MKRRQFLTSSAVLGACAPASMIARAAVRAPALESSQAAAHALNRMGFGPAPGDLANVARDPQAWVEQQLRSASIEMPASLVAALDEAKFKAADPIPPVRELVTMLRDQRAAAAQQQPEQRQDVRDFVRGWQLPAVQSRLLRALHSPRQLEEAMTDFWFNHFNVFQGKNFVRVLVGHYEHSAIRPHVMGRFRDLLGATAHHPAMLYYLDNWQSVGPQAAARGRGLNENYARELMELHTLGVDGGYTQNDVTQLARMLTGWTFEGPFAQNGRSTDGFGFVFNARLHDDGEKVWLGQRVSAAGRLEGEQALDVLARHPATARHVSFKLAQYFVSDQPDAKLVERMASVFLAQDGQIVPVLRTLFTSDAFWSPEAVGAKFKTPYHYTLSVLRAGGWGGDIALPWAGALAAQGMPLYGCQTPDGYRNTESAWLNADAMTKRLDFAAQVAVGRLGKEPLSGGLPAKELMANLGPLVTPATRDLVAQRESQPVIAAGMVLAGPGMMRR